MSTDRVIPPVRRAELEINAILQRLEAETGRVVEGLRLREADNFNEQNLAGAVIDLVPLPENRTWERLP